MSDLLERNLQALRRVDETAADRLRATEPATGLTWETARDGETPVATLAEPDDAGDANATRKITLASRFRPRDEATKFAESADLQAHPALVLIGFGLGYHVRALAKRISGRGVLVVHEPDLALLRAVLEHVDCTDLLLHPSVVLLVGEAEDTELTRRLEPWTSYITQGVEYLTHPPTRRRQPDAVRQFMDRFAKLVAFCRTNMATTLVHAPVTCHNLAHNLPAYAAGPTINELNGVAAGRPAVVVAAGPSLARNVHLLAQPGVRDRVVIIAVQTVLKPLLDRGVRPHFVTALDYHEISTRFYEGLPDDLDDVTLIAEPKVHPAVIDAYPGPVRVLRNSYLDRALGPAARPVDSLPAGSTVAHLSLYFAQHLGCDPILLLGQDLGFSDGLYYCPGTAIHDVWAPELSPFNTLEMMEWKRIARHKAHLQRREDREGKPIYTDEQMLTYLTQFERDFAAAPQTIIDATEGGMPKQHTESLTLAEALDRHADRPLDPLPAAAREPDAARLRAAVEQVEQRLEQFRELRHVNRQTRPLLEKMQRDQKDSKKMEVHFRNLQRYKQRVNELQEAFSLVDELNQIGVLKRLRSDRALKLQEELDPYERQARQLDRDIENVRWLIDGCDEALKIFRGALDRLRETEQRVNAPRHDAPKPDPSGSGKTTEGQTSVSAPTDASISGGSA